MLGAGSRAGLAFSGGPNVQSPRKFQPGDLPYGSRCPPAVDLPGFEPYNRSDGKDLFPREKPADEIGDAAWSRQSSC